MSTSLALNMESLDLEGFEAVSDRDLDQIDGGWWVGIGLFGIPIIVLAWGPDAHGHGHGHDGC